MERYGSGSIRIKKKQCHQTKVGACWLMLSYASLAKAGSWNYVYFYQKRIPEKNPMKEKAYTPDYIYIMYHIELL